MNQYAQTIAIECVHDSKKTYCRFSKKDEPEEHFRRLLRRGTSL